MQVIQLASRAIGGFESMLRLKQSPFVEPSQARRIVITWVAPRGRCGLSGDNRPIRSNDRMTSKQQKNVAKIRPGEHGTI